MAQRQNKLKVLISEVLQANGLLITIFLCIAIVLGGYTLIESPQHWWIALLLVAGVFAGVFLLINAAIVIKVAISLIVLAFTAAFSFQLGATIEPSTSGAFVWLFGTFVVYFGCLAISYLIPSGQSRWTVLILIELGYFAGVLALSAFSLALTWTAAAGILTAFVFYVLLFRFGSRSRTAESNMPQNFIDERLDSGIQKAATYAGLHSRPLTKGDKKFYIVWGERAYLIYPAKLEQAFGVIGRRKLQLSYKRKSVNPWLRYLNFFLLPTRKARGADILLVIADTSDGNGKEIKTIGVSIPDSKAVVPVGIIPSRLLLSNDEVAFKHAFAELDSSFEDFVDVLTEKQQRALEDFGKTNSKAEEPIK